MAVRFDNHADRLLYSGVPSSPSAYTFSCWLRIVTDRNNYSNIFAVEDNPGGTEWNELITENDGTTLALYDHSGGAAALSFAALSTGTWYFAAFSVGTSGAAVGYVASAAATSITRVTGTALVMSAPHHCLIGSTTFSEFFNGRIAHARLWDAVLSDADVANERWRTRPGRRANLHAWWPLENSAGKLVDYSGNGRNLTSPGAGSWATEDGPPTFGRRRKTVTVSTAASGATGTLAVTLDNGTSTATGAETFTGTAAQTLADATLAASGTGAATGTVAQTLADATSAAGGAQEFTGTVAQTLADATLSAAGAETFTASTAATLADATSAASGAETFTGALGVTLANATLAAAGVMGTGGSLSVTLADATCAGSGVEAFTGTTTATLENAASTADGTETFTGAVAQAFADSSLSAVGVEVFTGAVSGTLADATCSAAGSVAASGATGTVAVTLANATAVAVGAVAGVVPTDTWAHYRFNDIADSLPISDASGNGRSLAVTYGAGGYPKRVAGKLGKAREWSRENVGLHTPGNVLVGDAIAEGTISAAALCAFCDGEWGTAFWFKRRALDVGEALGAGCVWIFGSGDKQSDVGVRSLMNVTVRFTTLSGGIFQALVSFTNGSTVFGTGGSFTDYSPPEGEWVHIAINSAQVAGAVVSTLYVDGVLTQTLTSPAGLPNFSAYPPTLARFSVGARRVRLVSSQDPAEPDVINSLLTGRTDDVRLYSRLLSADEIAAIAALRAPFYGRVVQRLRNGGASAAELHQQATTAALRNAGSTSAELSETATRITLEDP